jgi:hypothetical protein
MDSTPRSPGAALSPPSAAVATPRDREPGSGVFPHPFLVHGGTIVFIRAYATN